jgi:phospholipase A1
MSIPPGSYLIQAYSVGYDSERRQVSLASGDTVRVEFILRELELSSEELQVVSYSFSGSENFDLMDVNYIIAGFGSPEGGNSRPAFDYSNQVKFRISIRYTALEFLPRDRRGEGGTGLHLAFEQNSFWHLYDNSSPFYDNNYKPGGFIRFSSLDFPNYLDRKGIPRSLAPSVNLGFFHESNGRDGIANRSWNRLTGSLQFGQPGETTLAGAVTAWYVVSEAAENADIQDVAGRGRLELDVAPFSFLDRRFGAVSGHLRSNVLGETFFRNLEANLLLHPFGTVGDYLKPSILLQFVHGYAENLLNYDEIHSSFRLGIAIVR